jgi:hypothetical protein
MAIFLRKFLQKIKAAVQELTGSEAVSEGTHKSLVSYSTILPGDILFFKYKSKKFGIGDHFVMVVANKRGKSGIFTHKGKRYLSAVKLNNIWVKTAMTMAKVYQNRKISYSNTVKKGLISLVGKNNYRTYILGQMYSTFEVNKAPEKKEVKA